MTPAVVIEIDAPVIMTLPDVYIDPNLIMFEGLYAAAIVVIRTDDTAEDPILTLPQISTNPSLKFI